MRQRTWTVLRRYLTRTTKYNRPVHKLWHRHRPHLCLHYFTLLCLL